MCGIVGVVNGKGATSARSAVCKYMEHGTLTGMLRGADSTGVFQVSPSGGVQMHKLPVDGYMFRSSKRFSGLINDVDISSVTIMHHRAATKGSVNYDNCHPFIHEDGDRYLIGVHNGSIRNAPARYEGEEFYVDSDYALYRIFKEGKEAFKNLDGAYAFVWYEDDHKLRIACNGERIFSFAFCHKKNSMLIASEPRMLEWLAERNSIDIDDVLQPDAHRLFTFDLNGDLRHFESEPFEKYKGSAMGGASVQSNFTRSGTRGQSTTTTADLVEFYVDEKKSTDTRLVGEVMMDSPGGVKILPGSMLMEGPRYLLTDKTSPLLVHLVKIKKGKAILKHVA